MRRNSIFLAVAFLITSAPTPATQCKDYGEMSGTVNTINVTEQLQYGIIDITITKAGREFYSNKGVIIGQVTTDPPLVFQNEQGQLVQQSSIDHMIFFADGVKMETEGDVGTIILFDPLNPTPLNVDENGKPCAFLASELITKAWGNKKLKKLSNDQHDVIAEGSVSFCSFDNHNEFELSGTVCFN